MLEYYIILFSLVIGCFTFAYYLINSYLSTKYRHTVKTSKVDRKEATIVVPVYKEDVETFTKCIKAIKEQKTNFIVVADSLKEPYRLITLENGGKFIFSKERQGKRMALSKAIGAVKTKYVLFVDSDTVIPGNALESMLSNFDESVGGVGTGIAIKLDDSWVSYCSEFFQKAKELVFRAMASSGSVFVISGRCCMYRVDLVKPLLQSDEFLNNIEFGRRSEIAEDMHITNHVLKSGYKAVIDYNVYVVTESQKSFKLLFMQMVRWARGGYLYFLKDIRESTYIQKGALYSFEMFYIYLVPIALIGMALLRLKLMLNLGLANLIGGGASGIANTIFLNNGSFGIVAALPFLTIILSVAGTSVFIVTLSKTIPDRKLKTIALGSITSLVMLIASIFALLTIWKQEDWLTR